MVVFTYHNTRTCEFIDMAKLSDRNIIKVHRKRYKYKDLEGPLLYDVFEKGRTKNRHGRISSRNQRQKNYHKYYHAVCIHLKRSLSCKYYITRYREEEGRVVGCRKPHRDLTIQHLLNPSHQDFIFNV